MRLLATDTESSAAQSPRMKDSSVLYAYVLINVDSDLSSWDSCVFNNYHFSTVIIPLLSLSHLLRVFLPGWFFWSMTHIHTSLSLPATHKWVGFPQREVYNCSLIFPVETLIKLKKRRVKLSYSHPNFSNPHRKEAHWKAEKLFSLHSAKRVYLSRTMKSAVNCPDTVSADWGAGPVDQLSCPKNNTKVSLEQVRDLSVLIMCDSWRTHCSFKWFFFPTYCVLLNSYNCPVHCSDQVSLTEVSSENGDL